MQRAFLFLCLGYALLAQSRNVTAIGSASVFASPDQVAISVTVSTLGTSAQDAASKNADRVNTLLGALQKLIDGNGELKTTSYYISPNYLYPSNGGTPTITGYTANSTVEATLRQISLAGPVIDTSAQSGATTISGLSFSLRDSELQRLQALKMATQQARAHADAMASAAGRTLGAVSFLQEGAVVRMLPINTLAPVGAGGAGATPVQSGLIEVQAAVTLTADLN